MTYRFELNFIAPRPGDPPFNPIWRIGLNNHFVEAGQPLITPKENYQTEIDQVIDNIIRELETIRTKLKNKYQQYDNHP